MQLAHATEVVAGVLLLTGFFVPLALTLLAPVIVNIVAFHALLAPSGLGLGLLVLVLEIGLGVGLSRGVCADAAGAHAAARFIRRPLGDRGPARRRLKGRHFLRVSSNTFSSFGLPWSKDVQVSWM